MSGWGLVCSMHGKQCFTSCLVTVVSGDTCSSIALGSSLTVPLLLGLNPILNPDCSNFRVGLVLNVCPSGTCGSVTAGDTCEGLLRRHHIPTLTSINNNTLNCFNLVPGRVIRSVCGQLREPTPQPWLGQQGRGPWRPL